VHARHALPLMARICSATAFALVLLRPVSGDDSPPAPVVFVCEHGSVKSLIAASLFDQAATDRGLPHRAVSRGIAPDARVPPAIAAALARDGFDVAQVKPQALTAADLAGATRVVAIGVDLPANGAQAPGPAEHWDDIPPASKDYPAARTALQRHIDELLDELIAAKAK